MKKVDFPIIILLAAISVLLSSCDGGITHITESEKRRMRGEEPYPGDTRHRGSGEGIRPYGKTIAGPDAVDAAATPTTGYTAGEYTSTPAETPKEQPKSIFIVPPGTLGEGGDVRDLIPELDLIGPEPGSEASKKCVK